MEARKVIKEEAKKLLKENIKNVFMVCLFLGVFSVIINLIIEGISENVIWAGIDKNELFEEVLEGNREASALYTQLNRKATLLSFLSYIASFITMFFAIPKAGFFLKQIEGKKPTFKELFSEKRYFESFKLELLIFVKVFLWTLLLIIPGIIKALAYSMAPYLKYKNPEKSSSECIKKSESLMNGYKVSLFVLYLSFIGWIILIAIGVSAINSVPFIGTYLSIIANFVFSALLSGYAISCEAIFYKELTGPYLFDKYNSVKNTPQPPVLNVNPFEEKEETPKKEEETPFDLGEERNSQAKNDGEKGGDES